MAKGQFSQFFSLDSAKAIKAREYGYMNAINYMAPANTAGVGNLCPHASPGCLALCLGWYSGQAAMLSNAELETGINAVRASRQRKARLFMADRPAFMRDMVRGIDAAQRRATRLGLKLCVRLNGATDIAWEGMRIPIKGAEHIMGATMPNVFAAYPNIQFVDYTKSVKRALRHARGEMPKNYHLTFSRSETNEADCVRVLEAGGNVAVVFDGEKPKTYLGHVVIDGDKHDLRFLDNRGACVVGLSPKGSKAKHDRSGFVVRDAA
jgi:acyl-CoA synthetase (AMP-forming)/AMP-acid ligase II